MDRRSLWTNEKFQKEAVEKLREIIQEYDFWYLIGLGPSIFIGATQNGTVEKESLWGHTDPAYGEIVAEKTTWYAGGEGQAVGMVVKLLEKFPELKKVIYNALHKEFVDKVKIEEQKLYKRTVD